MSVANKRLRLVKSSPPEVKRSGMLPYLSDLEFVYDPFSEKLNGISPSTYIRPIHGAIEIVKFREVIGRFHLSCVDVGLATDVGKSIGYVMGGASVEMRDIYEALYDPRTDTLRVQAEDIIGRVSLPNLLVINRMEVFPSHRGMGLGLAVLWHLIRRHSTGCGIVAALALPLQFGEKPRRWQRDDYRKKMDYQSFGGAIEDPKRKMVSLYEKLGFKQIGTDGVVAMCPRSLCNRIADICPAR
jgi:GNAT superfamily N-acetyltransferase